MRFLVGLRRITTGDAAASNHTDGQARALLLEGKPLSFHWMTFGILVAFAAASAMSSAKDVRTTASFWSTWVDHTGAPEQSQSHSREADDKEASNASVAP